jgi:hypothetical protein
VKKSYLFSYLAFCLTIPLLYISGDDVPFFGMHNTTSVSVAATVTTILSSSVSGNTFCEGDAITFSTTPADGTNYRFYINGILKQGPDNSTTFTHTDGFFDGDRVTVTLDKAGDTGTASLVLTLNQINDSGRVYFNDFPVAQSNIKICNDYTGLQLVSSIAANVNGNIIPANDPRYQWMSSPNGVDWNAIIGANQESFSPNALGENLFLRRDVISTLNGTTCIGHSNVLEVEVESPVNGGIIAQPDQVICIGESPQELTVNDGASGAGISYQWQKSLDNITFADVTDNAISSSYRPATVTQTTYFRRLTKSTTVGCVDAPSSVHRITPLHLDPGVFDPAHSITICHGSIPPNEFTSSPLAVGQPGRTATSLGSLSFRWEQSEDEGATWSAIGGAIERNYQSGTLTETTWFRRKVSAELNGKTCEDFSANVIVINVLPEIIDGINHPDQDVGISLSFNQKLSNVEKFNLNNLGFSAGLSLENFDLGLGYNFPVRSLAKIHSPSIFEIIVTFDFSRFRRNQRGYHKHLQTDNY